MYVFCISKLNGYLRNEMLEEYNGSLMSRLLKERLTEQIQDHEAAILQFSSPVRSAKKCCTGEKRDNVNALFVVGACAA